MEIWGASDLVWMVFLAQRGKPRDGNLSQVWTMVPQALTLGVAEHMDGPK